MFDLTSLQVECNKKFAFSADETLKTIQSLYEKKVTTYPRVDTTFLSDDIYPKCPGILKGLRDYQTLTAPLDGATLPKSKKVFDNSKVTDHHAIIPTGQPPQNLTDMERRVFDLIARRFIAVFYPDCLFATTAVIGEVEQIEFKVSGKQILEPGWRVVFGTLSERSQEEKRRKAEKMKTCSLRLWWERAALIYRICTKSGRNRHALIPRLPCCAPWKPPVNWWITTNCATL